MEKKEKKPWTRRDNLKYGWVSLIVLSVSCVLAGIAGWALYFGLTVKKLFPPDERRYDISEVRVAALKDICPLAAAKPGMMNYEDCHNQILKSKDLKSKLKTLQIPTFHEIVDIGVPRFKYLLAQNPETKDLVEVVEAGEPYLVQLPIPNSYFSVDADILERPAPGVEGKNKLKADVYDPYVLYLGAMMHANVCMGGRCMHKMTRWEAENDFLRLAVPENNFNQTEYVDYFGTDLPFSHGAKSEYGFFVAKDSETASIRRLLPVIQFGASQRHTAMALALFLLTAVTAFFLRQFFDYTALALVTASFAMIFVMQSLATSLPWLRDGVIRAATIAANLQLGASLITLTMSTRRVKPSTILKTYASFVFFTVFLTFYLLQITYFDTQTLMWLRLLTATIIFLVIPNYNLIQGYFECKTWEFKFKTERIFSKAHDFKNRSLEHLVILLFTNTIGGSMVWEMYRPKSYYFQGIMAPATGLLLLCLFGVKLYFTFSKANTQIVAESPSEVVRLKLRWPTKKLQDYLLQTQEAIFFSYDLRGSSQIENTFENHRRKLRLMNEIARKLDDLHHKNGFHWLLVKRAGDELQSLVLGKDENLRSSFRGFLELSFNTAQEFDLLVKSYFPNAGIHISVFYFDDLQFDTEGLERSSESQQDLDWSSRRADHFLKNMSGARRTDCLLIGGPEGLEKELTEFGFEVSEYKKTRYFHSTSFTLSRVA